MDTTSGRPVERVLVVANPAAGGVTSEFVQDVVSRCSRQLEQVRVHWTVERGDAARTVRSAAMASDDLRPDVVISVGGDGTALEVVTGLVDGATTARSPGSCSTPSLLVVPAGTGNSNYLAHWGETPWQEALDAALRGTGTSVRRLDLARSAEHAWPVLLGACSGVVAEALQVARGIPLAGRALYREAFTQVARACVPYPGRVTVDGQVVHEGGTVLANIGGGRFRGGTFKLLPHSILDDGELDVCVIGEPVDPRRVPELVLNGDHVGTDGVVYARGRRITVERTDGLPLWFEHDGELLDRAASAFTLDVLAGALPVICRAGFLNG